MGTRIKLLCILVLLVIVTLASSVSASVYNEKMESLVKARRSLLANGLGNTPPMGYLLYPLHTVASMVITYIYA